MVQQQGMEAASVTTTQAGGATAFVSALLQYDIGFMVGIAIGVIGLLMQWYFHRRRDKREQAEDRRRQVEHEARMRGEIE